MVENQLGFLFSQIAESIRGGLGNIGTLRPNAFPAKIDDIVSLIGTGGKPGGEGTGSVGQLTFASGSFPLIEDGQRVTIEHGLGVMPDLIIVQVSNYLNFSTYEEAAGMQAMMAAWGMRSTFGTGNHSGYTSTVWGLNTTYGIDNMPEKEQTYGYIFCPDEATFQVGSTIAVGKLYAKTHYRWLAISGIESGSGGSSADVRYVTFKSHDGQIEYGKKAVAVGDDCADPIARGVFATPTRESDVQYNYTFYGWATEPNGGAVSNWNKAITEDKTVYANFTSTVRYYTITYYDSDGTTVLKTESLPYGSTLSFVPEKYGYKFTGWTPELETVSNDVSYYATWIESVAFADAPWSVIAEKSADGTAAETWKVGDTKTIDITDNNGSPLTVTMVIGGFNHDDFADGTGKAGITLLSKMTPYKTVWGNQYSLYDASTLDTLLKTTIFNMFPEDLQSAIKSVNKTIDAQYANGENAKQATIARKVWAVSYTELEFSWYSTAIISNNGKPYAYYAQNGINAAINSGSTGNAWLRDLWRQNGHNACFIASPDGATTNVLNAKTATKSYGIMFGFCI